MCTNLIPSCKELTKLLIYLYFLKVIWHERFNSLNASGQVLTFMRKQYDKSNHFPRFVTNCMLHSVFTEESFISQMLYLATRNTNLSTHCMGFKIYLK